MREAMMFRKFYRSLKAWVLQNHLNHWNQLETLIFRWSKQCSAVMQKCLKWLSLIGVVSRQWTCDRAWIIRPSLFTCRPHLLKQLNVQSWPSHHLMYTSWISKTIFRNQECRTWPLGNKLMSYAKPQSRQRHWVTSSVQWLLARM